MAFHGNFAAQTLGNVSVTNYVASTGQTLGGPYMVTEFITTQAADDLVGLTDAGSSVAVVGSATEDTGLSDSVTVLRTTDVAATDPTGLTDLPVFTVGPVVTDTAGLADALAFAWDMILPFATTGLTDTVGMSVATVVTDTVGMVDDATPTLTVGAVNWTVAQTDTAGLTDSEADALSPVITDPVGLTDSPVLSRTTVAADTAGLVDGIVVDRTSATTDLAGLTDAVVFARGVILPTDSAGLTDTEADALSPVVTDPAGLVDTTTLSRAMVATDTVGSVDTLAFARDMILPTGTTGLTDGAPVVGLLGTVSDTTGLTDDATPVKTTGGTNWTQAPTDPVGLTDGTPVVGLSGTATDMSGLTDYGTSVGLGGRTTDDAGLSDGFNVAVVISSAIVYNQVATSLSGLTDSGSQYDYDETQDDAAGLTDSATPVKTTGTFVVTVNDTAGLTDTTAASRTIAVTDTTGIRDTAQPINSGGTNWAVTTTDDTGATDNVIKYQYVPEPVFHATLHPHLPDDDAGAVAGSHRLGDTAWTNRRRVRHDTTTWIGPVSFTPQDAELLLAVVGAATVPTDPDFSTPFYVSGRPGYLFTSPTVGDYAMWARDDTGPPGRFATITVT